MTLKYEVIMLKKVNDEKVMENSDFFKSEKEAIEFMYHEMDFIKRFFIEKDAVEWYPDLPYDTKEQIYSLTEKKEFNYLSLHLYKDNIRTSFHISVLSAYVKD